MDMAWNPDPKLQRAYACTKEMDTSPQIKNDP